MTVVKSKSLAAFSTMLLAVLATLGVVYGLWSQTLTLGAQIETGVVDAHMLLGKIDQGQYRDNSSDDQVNSKMKAKCYAELLEGPLLTTAYDAIDAGPDAIEIWVENGHPFFHCYVEMSVKNAGTVPIYVAPLEITNISGTLEPDVTVETQECWAQPIQLHPGQAATEMYPNCRVHIHVNKGAPELTVFRFEGSVLAWQWNE